mgnify:CR=1 FL=1
MSDKSLAEQLREEEQSRIHNETQQKLHQNNLECVAYQNIISDGYQLGQFIRENKINGMEYIHVRSKSDELCECLTKSLFGTRPNPGPFQSHGIDIEIITKKFSKPSALPSIEYKTCELRFSWEKK